jgi:hypothetical protein
MQSRNQPLQHDHQLVMPTSRSCLTASALAAALAACGRPGPSPEHTGISPEAAAPLGNAESPDLDLLSHGWREGTRYVYGLTLASQVTLQPAEAVTDFDLAAEIAIVPTRVTPETISLFMHFAKARFVSRLPSSQQAYEAFAKELSVPYFVTLQAGRVVEAQITPSASPMVIGIHRTVSAALQFQRARNATAAWTAREYDSTGSYDAEYSPLETPGAWRKRKLRYRQLLLPKARSQATIDVVPTIRASTGEMRLDTEGRPATVSSLEEVVLEGGQMPLWSKTTIALEARSAGPDPLGAADWETMSSKTKRLAADEALDSGVPREVLDDARIGGLSYDRIVTDLERIALARAARGTQASVDAGSTSSSAQVSEEDRRQSRSFTSLSANFRRRPETIRKAIDAVRRSSPARQTIIDALASAGSEESQNALMELMQGRALESSVRMSLVIALSRTAQPTEASVRFLRRLLNDDVAGTQALYGLGTFCQRFYEAGDHQRAQDIGEVIVERLAHAGTQLRVLEWLRAVSNAGHDGAFAKVKSFEKDEREQVRAEAVRAVRRMPSAEADNFIASRLNEDPSRAVKLSALDAARWRHPSDVLVRSVTTSASAADPHVRFRSVELMRKWLTMQPALRAPLERVAEKDSEEQIKALAKSALRGDIPKEKLP